VNVAVRSPLPVLALVILGLGGGELFLSARLRQNPVANARLCRYDLCDDARLVNFAYTQQLRGDPQSVATAIQLLADSLARDSASALRWADLGDALATVGSPDKARFCVDRAVELGHTSTPILVGAGQFYLQNANRLQGLRSMARALALTSELDEAIFSRFAAFRISSREVLTDGLPPGSRAVQSYLQYLIGQQALADAREVWRWMVARRLADRRIAVDYSDFLLGRKLFQEAAAAWAAPGGQPAGYRIRQFLYNGDFEQEPSTAALDWKIDPLEHVEVDRVPGADSGKFSLRIRFGGSANIDYSQVGQKVALPPGRYRFQAYIRTDNLTTDQGVAFRISDAETPHRLSVETEQVLGTTAWHPVKAAFAVSPATQLVDVRVIRRPSLKFDNAIAGAVWIGRLSLTRVE